MVGRRHQKLIIVFAAVTVVICVSLAVAFIALRSAKPQPPIPAAIAQKANFPVYAIQKLPKGYEIVPDSFKFSENVVIFEARSETQKISITEQQKPKNFNFEDFYQEQVTERAKLADVPFDSNTGTLRDGKTNILSVTTDKTWIFVTTQATLSTDSWATIARNIKPQD